MESLAALGLASAVCQLVDFSARIISEGKQIYKMGSSVSYQHLDLVTGDMEKLLSSMRQKFTKCAKPKVDLIPEEQVSHEP